MENSATANAAVTTLLLPMQQKPLLIPGACIAEVVDYSRPVKEQDLPDWCLGRVDWRGLEIPLVSFERLNSRRFAEFSATARIAVMNNTTGNEQVPFYGIVVQGLPQPQQVSQQDLEGSDDDCGPVEQARVMVREIPAVIPNLPLVEEQLAGQNI